MRSFLLTAAALPVVLACSNPDTDACAGAFVSSSAAAASFCATWTTAAVTETTAVPEALGSACAYKTKKLSTACACYVTGGAAASTSTSSAAAETTSAAASVETSTSSLVSSSSSAAPQSTTSASAVASTTKAASTLTTSTKAAATTTSAAAVTSSAAAGDANACTVTEYADISSAVASCTNIVLSGISAPASSTIDLQALQTGATVTFAGTTSFGYTEDSDFDPIVVSGHDITITGADGHVIDGNGEAYWDGEGSNGGTDKPDHFFVVKKVYNGKITNLNIQNWPGLEMTGLTLDNSAGDEPNDASGDDAAAHNSDGFDISSSDTVTLDSIKVYNQDDCVAVTSGSNIVVSNLYCSGGHGLSIGSIGGKSNNTVDGVTFSDSVLVDSSNGCRIKSNSGETGTVANVLYQNITMSGITDYGIDVQQDYLNGGPTGEPTNGVTISGIQFIDVTGTTTGDDAYDYYILCGDGSCSDFSFSGVSITGGSESCNYPDSGCP